MKKLISLFVLIAIVLFAPSVISQGLPLQQKQWYEIGVIGAPPDTSNHNGVVQQIANQTGLVNAAGNVCYAVADAGCRIVVALGGPLGVVSFSLMNGVDLPIANIGLNVASGNYAWGATTGQFVAERILETSADNVALIDSLQVASGLYGWDGAAWDRLTVQAAGDALSATRQGLDALAFNLFYDGTNFRRWLGAAAGDVLAAAPVAPYSLGLNLFYDGTNFRRWLGATLSDALAAAPVAPYTIALNTFYDGANNRRWQGVTSADNLSLPVAPWTNSVLMGYDGATLDMLRVGAVGELEVTDVATRPGEDAANDWRKVKKQSIAVYTPAATMGTAVAAAPVIVLASTEVLSYPNFCIYLKNAGGGGGGPLTDANVQVSPDGTLWISIVSTVCDAITTGLGCVQCVTNNAYRYVRVYATAAAPANDTTVDAWITANAG